MSLMKTLAKVAIGVAVAKGVASMTQKKGQQTAGATDDDGLFRGQHSPGASQKPDLGGLENVMDNILGGGQKQPQQRQPDHGQMGGIGGILEQLAGGGQQQQPQQQAPQSGGLNDILGQLGGGQGGLGGILGGLAKSMQAGQGSGGSFGEVLNSQFDSNPTREMQASAEQEAAAGLMIRAMIQAAKSDGKLDAGERDKLLKRLGDVSADEKRFVQNELDGPVDVAGLARQVPRGLEQQIYTMSVLGIDLDTQNEAKYLHELATALNMPPNQVNAVHARLGVPAIYR